MNGSLDQLLEGLGYSNSGNYLAGKDLLKYASHANSFRKAQKDLHLKGVYTLRSGQDTVVPTVYVVELNSDAPDEIREWHRQVWSQSIAPLILLATPSCFRLYRGFEASTDPDKDYIKQVLRHAIDALEVFSAIRAEAIDTGDIWSILGKQLHPESRVDHKLLDSLNELGQKLIRDHKLQKNIAHALIGKYVFLRYLRDRKHLSDAKLMELGVSYHDVFGRAAKAKALYELEAKLNGWLNGSIFQLPKGEGIIQDKHVAAVASAFYGDAPNGQVSMFSRYDFRYVPIETLSSVYEQFLHSDSTGKDNGAYYTPIHLVNFIIEELDGKLPLEEGMRVLDPSCGSGAFLVQCYRLLIEKTLIKNKRGKISPARLKTILENHIFGLDIDADACGVTELSLALTLLDYVDPPDLLEYPDFKLPGLRGQNIFHCDGGFFDDSSKWATESTTKGGYDWIIGNPPWKMMSKSDVDISVKAAFQWKTDHESECPIGDNQLALAFAWKVGEYLKESGQVGLVMPAMTLFYGTSTAFRKEFFRKFYVWAIANLSSMTYKLFYKRASVPAALYFYSRRLDDTKSEDYTAVFSPLLAEQKANLGMDAETWHITVEQSAIHNVPFEDAITGDCLPWKLAMWGSWRDGKLLRKLEKRFPTLMQFSKDQRLKIHKGLELRNADSHDRIIHRPDLVGRPVLDMDKIIRSQSNLFHIPNQHLHVIGDGDAYIRVRGGLSGLEISKPPHVIIHQARQFAIYSDDFVVVPSGQLGMAGEDTSLLKAISLYLMSDFVKYQQFLRSAQWGVNRSISTLDELKTMPVPTGLSDKKDIDFWNNLHSKFVGASERNCTDLLSRKKNLTYCNGSNFKELRRILNDKVYRLLGLRDNERCLIDDLVHVRMAYVKGKVPKDSERKITSSDINDYATILIHEMNSFLMLEHGHQATVYFSNLGAIVCLEKTNDPKELRIIKQDKEFEELYRNLQARLEVRKMQWLYFERNLRFYDKDKVYLFKPCEKLHWLKSRALIDADEIIADMLTPN